MLSDLAEIAQRRRGIGRVMARWQAWLFFPLLLLEAVALHLASMIKLLGRRDRGAIGEALLLSVHLGAYLTVIFLVLSPVKALVFVAVQQGLFGLYLGCTFAPNHKGMAIIDHDSEQTFVQRQVLTARNVSGGRLTSLVLGGLNYQIEHHLFPTMPRPNLRRAQRLVRAWCAEHDLPYEEDSLFGSYRQALRYLNAVAADPGT